MIIKELRKFPGFDSVNDEEAEEAICTIESLARILYHLWENDQKKKESKGKEDRESVV